MLYMLIYLLGVSALCFFIARSYAMTADEAGQNPWHWQRRINAETACTGAALLGLIHLITGIATGLAIYFA